MHSKQHSSQTDNLGGWMLSGLNAGGNFFQKGAFWLGSQKYCDFLDVVLLSLDWRYFAP